MNLGTNRPFLPGLFKTTDTARLDKLERVLLQARDRWPRIGIQTMPYFAGLAAYNKYHGNEAGLVYGNSLREAIDNVEL